MTIISNFREFERVLHNVVFVSGIRALLWAAFIGALSLSHESIC